MFCCLSFALTRLVTGAFDRFSVFAPGPEPPAVADVFLLVLSLIHELHGRAAALRRQAVLQRLVVCLPVCVPAKHTVGGGGGPQTSSSTAARL